MKRRFFIVFLLFLSFSASAQFQLDSIKFHCGCKHFGIWPVNSNAFVLSGKVKRKLSAMYLFDSNLLIRDSLRFNPDTVIFLLPGYEWRFDSPFYFVSPQTMSFVKLDLSSLNLSSLYQDYSGDLWFIKRKGRQITFDRVAFDSGKYNVLKTCTFEGKRFYFTRDPFVKIKLANSKFITLDLEQCRADTSTEYSVFRLLLSKPVPQGVYIGGNAGYSVYLYKGLGSLRLKYDFGKEKERIFYLKSDYSIIEHNVIRRDSNLFVVLLAGTSYTYSKDDYTAMDETTTETVTEYTVYQAEVFALGPNGQLLEHKVFDIPRRYARKVFRYTDESLDEPPQIYLGNENLYLVMPRYNGAGILSMFAGEFSFEDRIALHGRAMYILDEIKLNRNTSVCILAQRGSRDIYLTTVSYK